jgi:hypothetical protein
MTPDAISHANSHHAKAIWLTMTASAAAMANQLPGF